MSSLVAVGVNHKTAPVELRERLAIPEGEAPALIEGLMRATAVGELVLLSTCNRVELYAAGGAGHELLPVLSEARSVPWTDVQAHAFLRTGVDAARHVFRVASSLESMVVGEPQILGQVKDAVQKSRDLGVVGPVLDRCLNMAFRAAKRVRTETDIARGAAGVPSVAVELATSIFGELRGCTALVVGAGEMAAEAAVHLRAAGVAEIVVVNRSEERGRALAESVQGRYEPWSGLARELARADIVVTSTGAATPVIDPELVRGITRSRRYKPLFFVDIAVPRDVDARVAELDRVFVYDIDDLQGIVHDNLRARAGQTERANLLLEQELVEFVRWERSRAVGPLIGRLKAMGDRVATAEVERALARMPGLAAEHRQVVEQLCAGIVAKLLHPPISNLRRGSESGDDGAGLAEALQTLFALDADPNPDPAPTMSAAETAKKVSS